MGTTASPGIPKMFGVHHGFLKSHGTSKSPWSFVTGSWNGLPPIILKPKEFLRPSLGDDVLALNHDEVTYNASV